MILANLSLPPNERKITPQKKRIVNVLNYTKIAIENNCRMVLIKFDAPWVNSTFRVVYFFLQAQIPAAFEQLNATHFFK